MIKKEHKINPIPNYIDITKVDITKWEDGLYTLGLDKDKGLVIMEKPIYSSDGEGKKALYDDGSYKPTYDKEGIDTLLEGLEQTQIDNLELIKDLENKIKENKGNININKESIEVLKDANKVYDKIIENLKTDIKENQNNIININKSITDINEKLDKGTADINEVNDAIFKLNNKIISINKKIEELQTNVNNIKRDVTNIEKEISSIKFKIESLDKNYKLADQKIVDDYKKAIGALREEVRGADSEIIKAYKEADQKLYTKLDSDIKDEAKIREENDIKQDININKNLQNINQLNDMIKALSQKDEPIMSANGGGIISLPNNAMRSVAPRYKLNGLTFKQELGNPNFLPNLNINADNKWVTRGNLNLEYKDDYLIATVTEDGEVKARVETSLGGGDDGDKMYGVVVVETNFDTTNSQLTLGDNGNVGDNVNIKANEKTTLTGYTNTKNGDRFRIYINYEKEGDSCKHYSAYCVNLTKVFGEGNEPSYEWCKANMPIHIDEVKSVQTPMRIKSVGENLFNGKSIYAKNSYLTNEGSIGISYTQDVWIIPIIERTTIKRNAGSRLVALDVNKEKIGTVFNASHIVPYEVPIGAKWLILNVPKDDFDEMTIIYVDEDHSDVPEFIPYVESNLYINNQLELKSVGKFTDYIKDDKLYKNIKTLGEYYFLGRQLDDTPSGLARYCLNAKDKDIYNLGGKDEVVLRCNKLNFIQKSSASSSTEDKVGITTSYDTINNYFIYINLEKSVDFEKFMKDCIIEYVCLNTEIINLDTSGLITNHPNGTIFIEPITNKTDFYNKGLDISDYNIKEIEYMQIFEGNSYQDLDISKIEIKDNILTHPDIETGIVFISYYYDNTPIYSSNTVGYYNSDKTLKSPDGSIWKKVYEIDNEGKITLKGEKL